MSIKLIHFRWYFVQYKDSNVIPMQYLDGHFPDMGHNPKKDYEVIGEINIPPVRKTTVQLNDAVAAVTALKPKIVEYFTEILKVLSQEAREISRIRSQSRRQIRAIEKKFKFADPLGEFIDSHQEYMEEEFEEPLSQKLIATRATIFYDRVAEEYTDWVRQS
jgi:hypothetical protein